MGRPLRKIKLRSGGFLGELERGSDVAVRCLTEVGRPPVEAFCENDVGMNRPNNSATRDRAELGTNGARDVRAWDLAQFEPKL